MAEPEAAPAPKKEKKKDGGRIAHSYLEVNATKRAGFLMVLGLAYAFMVISVFANLYTQGNWTQLAVPSLFLGLPIVFYPTVEKWKYKPWQVKPQKYETHYRN